jgi:hypothetical protein
LYRDGTSGAGAKAAEIPWSYYAISVPLLTMAEPTER